jgi:IclR family KDG regulon transcriptional repressor
MVARAAPSELRASTVQSLDRGLQLLELLSLADEPQGLPEMADVLEVDRSTVHRLLATLLQRGFVQQDPESRRYVMGLKMVELSRRAIDRLSPRLVSKPYLKQLVQQTGESANLAILAGGQAICIEHEPSPSALAVTNEIGAVFALHATACGKVLIAALPPDEQRELVEADLDSGFTPRTITDLAALQVHLQHVQQQGYAVDDEERYIGARCVAAPVRGLSGKVVAAISLSGPAMRMTLDMIPLVSRQVMHIASAISAELGHRAGPARSVQVADGTHPVSGG